MLQPDRHYSLGTYRYGFNGKENDNEVKGEGNQQDYGFRIYDPRAGKFLSVDPITAQYPELTPYQFASNRPIDGIDLDGKEWSLSTIVEQIKAKIELKSYAEVTKIANQPRFVATGVSKIPTSVKVHSYYTQNNTTRNLANAFTLGIDGLLYNLFNDSKIVGTSIINGPQHSTDLAENKIDEKGRIMAFTNVTGTLLSLGEFASIPRPQGINAKDFSAMSKYLKSTVGDISNDIVVQGSRASGTATATSDVDIAIKVAPEQFDELISKAFGTPNVGSAKWKTMQHAIKTGKITTGDAGLRSVKNGLLEILDMKVDLSVIKKGGPFDNGVQIPIRGGSSNKTK
jgi:RHS repeat-associated protein